MDKIISDILKIANDNNIKKVMLFGSRARGDFSEASDYDFAFVSPNVTAEQKSSITDAIEELDTFRKIDAVFLKDLNGDDELTKNILKDGVTVMNKYETKLSNFRNALNRLQEAIDDYKKVKLLSVRDGVIQRFEFTTELSWKTVREYLLEQGVFDVNTPKNVMREAFNAKIIEDEQGWLQILNDRNATSHIYDEKEANEIFARIEQNHIKLFNALIEKL